VAAPRLSAMFTARLVAGVMTVTRGSAAMNLRKNWAQLWASNSWAHAGTSRPATRFQRRVRPKGT
jgi:hypothetical protein